MISLMTITFAPPKMLFRSPSTHAPSWIVNIEYLVKKSEKSDSFCDKHRWMFQLRAQFCDEMTFVEAWGTKTKSMLRSAWLEYQQIYSTEPVIKNPDKWRVWYCPIRFCLYIYSSILFFEYFRRFCAWDFSFPCFFFWFFFIIFAGFFLLFLFFLFILVCSFINLLFCTWTNFFQAWRAIVNVCWTFL